MYGLLGKKLTHSFSPFVHERINRNIDYRLYETLNVGAFLSAKPFKGINVTNPYKQTVIRHLDTLDDSAEQTQSVNTITNTNGTLKGYNTDFIALKEIIQTRFPKSKNTQVTIMGNGATMRSIKQALLSCGYENIRVCARNPKETEYDITSIPNDVNVLINATPKGMYPDNDATFNIDFANYSRIELVFDLIYNPFFTNLLLNAKRHSIKTMNGLELLIRQALHSQKLFGLTNIQREPKDIARTIQRAFTNIVFIGLPFSGKTYYGQLLAKDIDRPFVDIDQYIEDKVGMSVPNIFQYKGERYFRQLEKNVIKDKAAQHRQIIAPGGGAVLDHEAMQALRQNAFIIYLDLEPSLLEEGDLKGRPLVSSVDDVVTLKREREALYRNYADTIISRGTADDTVILNKIKEALHAYLND